jgi:hypothetical protein
MKARLIPARFIAFKSSTTPSFDIFPDIQYQYTAVCTRSDGDLKPASISDEPQAMVNIAARIDKR